MTPFSMYHKRPIFFILPLIFLVTMMLFVVSIPYSIGAQDENKASAVDEIYIHQIAPDERGGRAYKLVYFVKAPIDSYWKFKTDFDNDFITTNKYIEEHNFILQKGNTVITENKYTNSPEVYFKWRTNVLPEAHRLEFELLNPEMCKQKFHYGHIQLESVAVGTRVTQVAYFDFLGAYLWTVYPWKGGMKDILTYTAHWEQETMLQLKSRYEDKISE
jgi:hypothetical protein